jgi:hypothetical protein
MHFNGTLCAVLLAGTSALSVSAEVIYDSSSLYQAGSVNPDTGGVVNHVTQAYAAQQVTEFGGMIGLAGSARDVQSATVQMRTGPAGGIAVAGNIDLTLNFYAVNPDRSLGALLGSRTQNFSTPAGSGTETTSQRPYFDCTFDLSSLGLLLPTQVYYGVALDYNQNSVAQSINLSLWNYGADPGGFGPYWYGNSNPTFIDGAPGTPAGGSSVKIGTDLITGSWGRFLVDGSLYTLDGTDPVYTGLTPNITITAIPAPGVLAMLGLVGIGGRRRRRGILACGLGSSAFMVGASHGAVVVDDFTTGAVFISTANLNAATSPVSSTDPAFFPGSNGVRSFWIDGRRGQTVFTAAGNNLQQVSSNGDGSASFITDASRTGSGSTKSYAFVSYGGAGTDLDLSSFTSFDVAGSGTYYRSASTLTYAFAFLTLTDTAGKTAVWKTVFENATPGSTVAVGNFGFDLSGATGLPPTVQSGFNIGSIQKLTVNFETGVTGSGTSSAASTWAYTATSFQLVPAPGALALLGVAGLAGSRRRR